MTTPIHINLSKPFEPCSPTQSYFWGNPLLPVGYDYPTYTYEDGEEEHMLFLCQINLAEIAPHDKENVLPHKGMLLFFANIDHYLGRYDVGMSISGYVSEAKEVRVLYFPDLNETNGTRQVLIDDDDEPIQPEELTMTFSPQLEGYNYHALLSEPDHREWDSWDAPFEDWQILLQVDSMDGTDFNLNFMDCGVLDLLISPEALAARDFSDVRGIVLST